MIKLGTLCIIVYAHEGWKGRWLGHICTVTGRMPGGGYRASLQRPQDGIHTVVGSARCLRPLNEPESAPAAPAYAKREQSA